MSATAKAMRNITYYVIKRIHESGMRTLPRLEDQELYAYRYRLSRWTLLTIAIDDPSHLPRFFMRAISVTTDVLDTINDRQEQH